MAAMEERMIVSGGDEVRVFAPPKREPQEQIRLEGAGALCVSHGPMPRPSGAFLCLPPKARPDKTGRSVCPGPYSIQRTPA